MLKSTATAVRVDRESIADEPPLVSDRVVVASSDRRLLALIAASTVSLLILASFFVLYFAKAVFFPLTLAIILQLIFAPVVKRLNQWHVPIALSAASIVAGIVGIVIAGVIFLASPAQRWIEESPQHFHTIEYKLRSIKEPIERVNAAREEVDQLTRVENGSGTTVPVQVRQPGIVTSLLNNTGGLAVASFLTLVLLYFLLAGGDRLLEKVTQLSPATGYRRRMICLVGNVQQSISSYLLATTCINVVLGIVIGVGMWLAGLPNPILWGVMAACLNYIPYFGCVFGGCIVFLVGLISLDSPIQAAIAPLIYFSANMIEGYFITPSILGRSISLSPLAIIVSMMLWGWLWGVGGLLLAVPILVASKVACDHIESLQSVGRLLGR